MRRLLKFLHTMGAAGMMGGMAALAIMFFLPPALIGAAGHFPIFAMAKIAAWIIGPSMVVTVISGLLAIAITPVFHEAGWVWVKAATGILILQASAHLIGPIQEEAKRSAGALAADIDPASAVQMLQAEANTLWVLLGVSVANVALGVWRPRLPKYPV